MKRIPREYAELRMDLSRDALVRLHARIILANETNEELQNLRNQTMNLIDRFDEKLTA